MNTKPSDFRSSGASLVHRILIRRRRKCIESRAHTIGRCEFCGVHQ